MLIIRTLLITFSLKSNLIFAQANDNLQQQIQVHQQQHQIAPDETQIHKQFVHNNNNNNNNTTLRSLQQNAWSGKFLVFS